MNILIMCLQCCIIRVISRVRLAVSITTYNALKVCSYCAIMHYKCVHNTLLCITETDFIESVTKNCVGFKASSSLWDTWTILGIQRQRAHENQPGLCGSSPGNSVQTNISAQQVLCVDSGIGVYQPQTACVSTINKRRAPCLGKQASRLPGFQARCCCKSSSVNTPSCAQSAISALLSVIKTWECCVAPTHLTQSVPLCHVMAFQCCDIIQDAHAHVRPCMFSYVRVHPLHIDADSTTEVCWHAPTWQRGLFCSPWGKIRFLQASDDLRHIKA